MINTKTKCNQGHLRSDKHICNHLDTTMSNYALLQSTDGNYVQ